jgi:hypothetical protein
MLQPPVLAVSSRKQRVRLAAQQHHLPPSHALT